MSQITSRTNASRLQNVPIDPTTPTDGQILIFNGITGQWEPSNPPFTSEIVLGALTQNGVWYPSQFVGPNYFTSSASTIDGFNGSGAAIIPRAGKLSKFKFWNALPPGSDIPVDLYLAPNANPSLFSYTGISLTMLTGAYVAYNNADELTVAVNDILVFYNPSFVTGYTPSSMTITAQLVGP